MSINDLKNHPVLTGGAIGILISVIFYASSLHAWIAVLADFLMKPAAFVIGRLGLMRLAYFPCSFASDEGAFLCNLATGATTFILTNVVLFALVGYMIAWFAEENAKSKTV